MENIERIQAEYNIGLTSADVSLRQTQGLTNESQEKITKTTSMILRENICTYFNALNLAIAICLAMVHAWTNIFYLSIIIVNIIIGITQEIRAKRTIEKLSILSAPKVTVVRDRVEQVISVDEVVLDDIVILETGKQVTTDAIVIHGAIEANESLLTGEADPIEKVQGKGLLSGSFVVSGRCYARVEHVGAENYAAKLANEAKVAKKVDSVLLTSMRRVTKFTGFFIIPIGILLFLENYFITNQPIMTSVVSMAAALLGMLPKGLVLLISVSLAAGVVALARKKVLVQDLYCMETLARVDLLCLDKTGTITEGTMKVSDVFPLQTNIDESYMQTAISTFIGASEDNNATIEALKNHFRIHNPYKVLKRVPFSSARKWSAVQLEGLGTLVLGAPERILGEHANDYPIVSAASQTGDRIICLGFSDQAIQDQEIPSLIPLVAIALNDPVRKSAKKTLDFFKSEGVDVKIISGDHPVTVSNVARQAGLEAYANYIDMSRVSDDDITSVASQYTVFGRVTPGQKQALVKAFKSQGHTVAMTGDGVNDVLALREADCSIAMGNGSDASKQASQVVLLNSDFSVIPGIAMEGRRVVNNITRVASVFFVKTIYSVLLSLASILTLGVFPFIPIQITLIDGAVEAFPAFVLTLEPTHKRIKGTFLKTVLTRALPFSLTILVMYFVIQGFAGRLSLSGTTLTTVIYYVTAFISIAAMVKSCYPFTRLRIIVAAMSGLGFYVAAFLFTHLLQLERLTVGQYMIVAMFSVVSVGVIALFMLLVKYGEKYIETNGISIPFVKNKNEE